MQHGSGDPSHFGLNSNMSHLGHHYYPHTDSSRQSYFFPYQNHYPDHSQQVTPPRDYSPETESSQMSPDDLGHSMNTPGIPLSV